MPLFDDSSDEEKEVLEVLHSIPDWPVDVGKDLATLRNWQRVYPQLDLLEEAVKWAAWMTEHESRKKVKHRARFGNWLSRAEKFRRDRTKRSAYTHRRAEQEGHGGSVEARRDW